MKITFDITTEEADIIAEQYAYNSDVNPDKDDFVLEQFKQFGRTCIESKAFQVASVSEDLVKKNAVDLAKAAISF